MYTEAESIKIVGELTSDFFVTHENRFYESVPGGSGLYSAIGARIWSDHVDLVARIGRDYPEVWLNEIASRGLTITNIHRLDEDGNHVRFFNYSHDSPGKNPVHVLGKLNIALPKAMIHYGHIITPITDTKLKRFDDFSIRARDIDLNPAEPFAIHIGETDFVTHASLLSSLSAAHPQNASLLASGAYMYPANLSSVTGIVSDLDVLILNEIDARKIFRDEYLDIWDLIKRFGTMGARYVVLLQGRKQQLIYDQMFGDRWVTPAFPNPSRHIHGSIDTYCGGLIAGFAQTGDIVEASVCGNVSASLVASRINPLDALESFENLKTARRNSLLELAQRL